jgi:hypothetical protein
MYSGKIAVPPGGGGIGIIIYVFQENNNKTLQDCT